MLFEIEAKTWYVLSKDPLTARFYTSRHMINEGTLVMVVGWALDGVVSGSPVLMRVHATDARELAVERDAQWVGINAASHRVVEPTNTPGTPRNKIRNQVVGEIMSKGGGGVIAS
ncbi:hypothetical protein MUG78_17940 [Gordonia alkaliphila]|uniref:hypothetical protein n=1 Tax=Gordonia alkaliphila TaxID=1053547 RepID=UPI001FF341D6|nr:hypothetical protein [Gordonia alkaliphila]MCK0441284.1 hypothetical protein [Gordonia alkaliphila]